MTTVDIELSSKDPAVANLATLIRTSDRLGRILDELQQLPVNTEILTHEEQQEIDRAIKRLEPIADRLDARLAGVIEP